MAGAISVFRVARCPKCFKLLTECTDIPVYKCGACNTLIDAKGYNVTTKSVTSRSDSRSINTPLTCSDQSILSSSNLCSSPSSNNESISHEKGFLSIIHADRDETSLLHLERIQHESIDKNMNALHKNEENGNQLRPGQLIFDNSKSQDQLKSSLNFTSTLEGNAATVLKSQTCKSSYAYDAGISSIDGPSIDHILNKNHLMSVRTFRHERPSKLVSNILKDGEEDIVQAEYQINKIPLKSRTRSNEVAAEGNACTNRKLQSLRCNLPAYRKRPSVESLPFSSRVEFEKNQAFHLREPTFISNALRRHKQDRIDLSSNMYDIRNLHIGHHQCSLHSSHSFCCNSSMRSSCVYNIHHSSLIEEVEKLKTKDKRLQARRQCRPISNGAPFVICGQCLELLRLPMDFFVSKRGSNKLQCGACSKILVLQFPAKDCSLPNNFADAKCSPQVVQSPHSAGNASLKSGNSLRMRNSEPESLPPLHLLMGYFSATEVLYQVTDVDEGYESSEPAMPDSYIRYEEEKHKNLLLQFSEEEAYFGSVEVEEKDDSSKILNKREQSHLRSLIDGVKRIETWGSKV